MPCQAKAPALGDVLLTWIFKKYSGWRLMGKRQPLSSWML
ncbi:hypothetical protein P353_09590 [Comamonas testosteroni]|uniref:Uncharacterized protein n=1 Tax=Comamonas testosteroni TaxID=285 RepID=A0A096FLU5_COMTE|nr:hypothetical protein P353_09590 [Comamonas testosteroni]